MIGSTWHDAHGMKWWSCSCHARKECNHNTGVLQSPYGYHHHHHDPLGSTTWHVPTSSNLHTLSIEVSTLGSINYLKPNLRFQCEGVTVHFPLTDDLQIWMLPKDSYKVDGGEKVSWNISFRPKVDDRWTQGSMARLSTTLGSNHLTGMVEMCCHGNQTDQWRGQC